MSNHPTSAPKNALGVISSAVKLIMRPDAGRPVLPAPEGVNVSPYSADKETPTTWVINMTETPPSCQGVSHETGSVIVNGVPHAVAEAMTVVRKVHGVDNTLQVLSLLGYSDQYTTNLKFIADKLSAAGTMLDPCTGVVKRDDKDIVPVWREADGRIYVVNNKVPHLIQPDILARDYRTADGGPIDLASIPLAERADEPATC
jgi:hypothetical protein